MTKSSLFQSIAIFLPVIVICGWIGSYAVRANLGQEVTLRIEGFDPRDLIAGHYLHYQVDYGRRIDCTTPGPRCLCLAEVGPHHEVEYATNCQDRNTSCRFRLRGNCQNDHFVAGIERFYFPEQYQNILAVVPPASTIKVSLSRDGRGVVKALEVDGTPLYQWLKLQENIVP